jgi:hypothetical protein
MKNFSIGLDKQTLIEEIENLLAVSKFHRVDDILTNAIMSSLAANGNNQDGINLIGNIPVDGDIVFLDSEHNKIDELSLASLSKGVYAKFQGKIKFKKEGSAVKYFNFQPDLDSLVSFETQTRHYFDLSVPFKPNEPFVASPVKDCNYYSQYQFSKLSYLPRQENFMPSSVYTFGINTSRTLIKELCIAQNEEFIDVEPIMYSSYSHLLYSIKELKTQVNLEIISAVFKVKIYKLLDKLNPDTLSSIQDKMFPVEYFTYEENMNNGVRFGITYYRSMITGCDIVCSCASDYLNHIHNQLITNKLTTTNTYHLVDYLKDNTHPRLCHLCVIEDTDLKNANALYGPISHYAFAEMTGYYESITPRSELPWVYNNLEVAFKETKWVNEHKVFTIARDLLPKKMVIREASPYWLNQQRLDVYFPELNMAIEYQGKQHFEPIDYFGGVDAFIRNQERDKRKAQRCKENGVHLIYIDYTEKVNKVLIKRKLARYL